MSYNSMKDLYDTLYTDTDLNSKCPSGNIRVGWKRDDEEFPSISLIQQGGSEVGLLGYSKSSGNVAELFGVQINIYSRENTLETYDIYEKLRPIMISGGYEKTADVDDWNNDLSAHVKITRWNLNNYYEE